MSKFVPDHRFKPLMLLMLCLLLCMPVPVWAQNVAIPNFWDRNERFAKPDLTSLPRLKFLTTTDFPPFNFIDRRKRLSGFHVDLARAVCEELGILNRCQIQALPWAELAGALEKGEGDAIIAGLAITEKARETYAFTLPYLQIPGRFVVRKQSELQSPAYEALFRKVTGVVSGSAHAAYFDTTFGERESRAFPTRQAALDALMKGEVEAVFSDAVSLSFWLASSASKDCCAFFGGPYVSVSHFGPGMAIALRKDNPELVEGINHALQKISETGKFAELYLRYFPVGLF